MGARRPSITNRWIKVLVTRKRRQGDGRDGEGQHGAPSRTQAPETNTAAVAPQN